MSLRMKKDTFLQLFISIFALKRIENAMKIEAKFNIWKDIWLIFRLIQQWLSMVFIVNYLYR